MIKIIKYFFQAIIIYIFFLISLICRLNLSRKLFSNFFLIFGPFLKSKKIISKNLETYSPDISEENKKLIREKMWKNYGMTFAEYMFLKKFRNQNSHITIKREDILFSANHDKPVIFVSGHFANFELMSMEISKKKINLATIYRPLNNIFLNPLMEYLRKKYICKNQIKKGLNGVREAIEYIKKNHSVALMIDQRVSEGDKINFFGKSALTTTLPAQLAIKFNLDIVPVFIERTDSGNFILEFKDIIKTNEFSDKILLTKKLNEILEQMIKQNPYQWIWTHNRWK